MVADSADNIWVSGYTSGTMDGVSLHVAPGESIGLVGRSGSGKSTVLQIVMRFYNITGGSASLDKKNEFADPETIGNKCPRFRWHRSVANCNRFAIATGRFRKDLPCVETG